MHRNNAIGDAARLRAIRHISTRLGVPVDPCASYDDLRATLGNSLSFYADMWLTETLDLVERAAVAELDPNAWSDEALPVLTPDEIDAQTDQVVLKAFEDDEAPTPGAGI